MIAAKGFAIKKVLKNGKLMDEQGIMGEFNKQGARIVEVSDGKVKYTELTANDIMKLISHPASHDSLEYRIAKLATRKHRHHHHHRHHSRVDSRHHTKRHRHRRRYKKRKRRTHRHKHHRIHRQYRRHRTKRRR